KLNAFLEKRKVFWWGYVVAGRQRRDHPCACRVKGGTGERVVFHTVQTRWSATDALDVRAQPNAIGGETFSCRTSGLFQSQFVGLLAARRSSIRLGGHQDRPSATAVVAHTVRKSVRWNPCSSTLIYL
ncbi:unnamed protein product, partial [Ectocarpus sp. 12 AP-2014]